MATIHDLISEIERSYDELNAQLADPEVLGDRLQSAGPALRAGQAVQWVIGEQQLHRALLQLAKKNKKVPRRQLQFTGKVPSHTPLRAEASASPGISSPH